MSGLLLVTNDGEYEITDEPSLDDIRTEQYPDQYQIIAVLPFNFDKEYFIEVCGLTDKETNDLLDSIA